MSIIQLFIVAFSLFAIARTLRQFRRGKLTIAFLLLWILFWVAVGGVVLIPQTTNTLAHIVGVGRGVDAIMYVSIIALFYGLFRMLVRIEEVEREITKLVRRLAIDSIEEKK